MQTSGRVLKSEDVALDGRHQITLSTEQVDSSEPALAPAAMGSPQARIVENQPDYVVIEISCACGTKLRLKCDYADDSAQ